MKRLACILPALVTIIALTVPPTPNVTLPLATGIFTLLVPLATESAEVARARPVKLYPLPYR